ncbi:hypothetical protein CAEBREN_03952 [Caenorhabditis brenneri]|uniref:DUF281 domain-containing protein n=1 Tax=Caenorhabditis brenneri TaxID=135651 RepID=G0NJC4_CAEBE|nr:hypothetical protein CAEBREN_03952 [Caenorhabditis brenneri]
MVLLLIRLILVLLFQRITVVEGCVRTIPPEEYYPSSTLPMETDLCKTCKIDEIEPENMPTGTVFESTPITGDCITTTAKCSRTDGKVCTSVTISSVTSTGSTVLGTTPNGNGVSVRLDCEDDGLFSSGATTRIIQLACEFTGCELPCTTCDIAPMAPTGLPAGESFEYSQTLGPDGCVTAPVSCKRTDGLICQKISLLGPGGVEITSGTGTTAAGTTLTCQGDGKFAAGGVTGINQLSCVFTDCSACTTCDISTIAPPTPAPTGTMFESEELAAPGACKSTKVTCSRTDGQICVGVAVQQATIPSGTTAVITSANSGTASGTLTCGPDGFYLANGQQISQLSCVYTDCKAACESCNAATLTPPALPTGTSFTYTDMAIPGCKSTEVTCKKDDMKLCDQISISVTNPSGSTQLSNVAMVNKLSVFLTCGNDGLYAFDATESISALSCNFVGCPSCETCSIMAIAPLDLPPELDFDVEYVCPSVQVSHYLFFQRTRGSGSLQVDQSDL